MQSKLAFLETEVEDCIEWCSVCLLVLEQAQTELDEDAEDRSPIPGFELSLRTSAVEVAKSAHKAALFMLAEAEEALEAYADAEA